VLVLDDKFTPREGWVMAPAGKEAADALRRSPLEALR